MALAETLDLLMFAAACVLLLAGFPVAFTLAGVALMFAALGHMFGIFDMAFLGAFPQRIFGNMTNEVLIAVPLFVFMGVMLERSKVAADLLDSMGRLFGTLRGGLGISVTIVGALLAASTGIVGATVVTMGLLSLPAMIKHRYDPALAAGTIAAAGTLGQIIPPSIVLVLLGDTLSSAYQNAQLAQGIFAPETLSVGDLFAGALLPGLMLVGLYIAYQIMVAILRPDASPALVGGEGDTGEVSLSDVLRALMPPLSLIIVVLGSILGGLATPTEAAAVGAVGATMLAGLRMGDDPRPIYAAVFAIAALLLLTSNMDLRVARDEIPALDMAGIAAALVLTAVLTWGVLVSVVRTWRSGVMGDVARTTTHTTSMVFVILVGAALFSLVFRGLGGDDTVHELLSDMPGGTFGAVAVVMLVMFVLGFFLDFLEIIFVVVPIVAPVIMAMGVDPVWLGVMIAVNLQTSFLTPPFGFALFYLRGVAPDAITTMHIYKGVIPFVIIQIIALLLLALFPGIATWLPGVLYN